MNLAVDIGNSMVKAAVFDGGQLVETFKDKDLDASFLKAISWQYPDIDAAILSSTREDDTQAAGMLSGRYRRFVRFDRSVRIPLTNMYGTPDTLGLDRLAAAVGANAIYPDSNVLIMDFGTAITIDIVTRQGQYLGGNISPGAGIRFRALHDYTGKLPLGTLYGATELTADNTKTAIDSGVVNGIIYETEGYIARLEKKYRGLKIIFTGGDGNFFAERVKNTIFATQELVVYGLNRILEYNAD